MGVDCLEHDKQEMESIDPASCDALHRTGPAFCGCLGYEQRRDYTMIGDTVNLAARLMGASKSYPPSEFGGSLWHHFCHPLLVVSVWAEESGEGGGLVLDFVF